MSDLRGLSRGSKTAAVVILVVLLQVIVVAVLGLGAIAQDRAEGTRIADAQVRTEAERIATSTREQMREGLQKAVPGAAGLAVLAREPGSMRAFQREHWSAAFTDMYRVDARGRFQSFGGLTLYVPPEVAAEEARQADVAEMRAIEADLDKKTASPEKRRLYVRKYWFRTDDKNLPRAAGEAVLLAEAALDALVKPASGTAGEGAVPAAVVATEAVLLAFETVCMNEGQPGVDAAYLSYVASHLDSLVARPDLPAGFRETLSQSLDDLRRARQRLPAIREWAIPVARAMTKALAPPKVFHPRDDDVIAAVSMPRGTGEAQALVVRIDRRILAASAEGDDLQPPGRHLNLSARVVTRTDPSPERGVEARLSLQMDPDFDPGLDVIVVRSGPATSTLLVGPRETFYLTILGLATLGLIIAAMVLLRIYRRDVHLARLKADFVSNLSHELKTPLTSISMFVEMIREGRLSSPEDLREGMDVIAQESDRLQRIVGRMIEVARRESEPTRHDLNPGDLNAPVRSACERFRRLERDPGLTLTVDLAPHLPLVRLDPAAIDDAVTNLLANAWKYRRGDAAKIRCSTRPWRKGVELAVEDDGIGIPRAERRRIFEMFYRAEDYLSRAVPGTGLGLALVRTIVRAHRGKIRVEGAHGEGTTFRIRFPAAPSRGAPPPPTAPPAPPVAEVEAVPPPAARSPLGGSR